MVKEGGEGGEGEERGWWASKDIEGEEDRKRYEGLGESLKMIEEVNEREGLLMVFWVSLKVLLCLL